MIMCFLVISCNYGYRLDMKITCDAVYAKVKGLVYRSRQTHLWGAVQNSKSFSNLLHKYGDFVLAED
jgi:hypothetical protein